jgi:hypothetical protein
MCPTSWSSQHMRFSSVFRREVRIIHDWYDRRDAVHINWSTSQMWKWKEFPAIPVSEFHEYRCDLEVTVFWTHAQDFTASYPLPCSQNNQTENVICLWYYSSTKLWCRVFGIQFVLCVRELNQQQLLVIERKELVRLFDSNSDIAILIISGPG